MKILLALCLVIAIDAALSTIARSDAGGRQTSYSRVAAGTSAVRSSIACSDLDPVTAVRITKTITAVPGFRLVNDSPFTRTSARKPATQRLYWIVCSLPAIRSPQRASCGADWGVAYHLTFRRNRAKLLRVSAEAGGCAILYHGSAVGRGPAFSMLGPVYFRFWCALAMTLRMPEANLFAYPAPRHGPTQEERTCGK